MCVCVHTKIHLPSCSSLIFRLIKQKDKWCNRTAAILSCYLLQKSYPNRRCVPFHAPIRHARPDTHRERNEISKTLIYFLLRHQIRLAPD